MNEEIRKFILTEENDKNEKWIIMITSVVTKEDLDRYEEAKNYIFNAKEKMCK